MQGYYVAGMYVSGDHLCHANVDVAGFWRNLKSGGRVWVNSFQRNVKGLASNVGKGISKGYRIGSQGKALQFGPTPQRAKNDPAYNVGYKIGTASVRVGHTAGRVARGARQFGESARTQVRDAGTGFRTALQGRQMRFTKSAGAKVGYAAGKAAKHISDAASTVIHWGSEQIGKAKTFIEKLFGSRNNGVSSKEKPVSSKEKPVNVGKQFMNRVFESVKTMRDAGDKARSTLRSAKTTYIQGQHGDHYTGNGTLIERMANEAGLANLRRRQNEARKKYGWINEDRLSDDGASRRGRGRY